MKVSVLVTFYNQEDYVDEALQSVFDQKCDFDFEVLIGDDGSTDGTMAKLQKWKQKYPDRMEIYVMDREPGVKYNSSQRASRNRLNLLQYVKGEYFAYLDGDDFYIDDHKLQKQVEIMDQPENAKYAVCAHNVYAYVLQNGRTRYSDDGEPAKTAGTPVLETIGHAGVADVIVVVTRYFGGILLGTGGLVRAYTAAASGALQQAELVSMRLVVDCSVRVSYAQFEQAQRIIAAAETRLDEPVFDDAVTLCWRMPAGQEGALCTALNELTRGGAEVEISKPQYAPF